MRRELSCTPAIVNMSCSGARSITRAAGRVDPGYADPVFGPLRYLATGPALSSREREAGFSLRPSGVRYTGSARTDAPVAPILAWGAAYDLDLVVVSDHPAWDMHEIARLAGSGQWIAKDARRGTLEQIVTVDLPDPDVWLPELPVERRAGRVEVEERATDRVDVVARWTTPDGEPAVAELRGPFPAPAWYRNGPTLGHSRDALLAVLDVSRRSPLTHARLTVGGAERRVSRIGGLIPFRFALAQAQGGLATGAWEARGDRTVHATRSGGGVAMAWTGDGEVRTTRDPLRTLACRFVDRELAEMTVHQAGAEVTRVVFSPSLPDFSRTWTGSARSRWVIDVGGQRGHAFGEAEAWTDRLEIVPTAPRWVADRPLRSLLSFDGRGAAAVATSRVHQR
jgi:hypothetical protein